MLFTFKDSENYEYTVEANCHADAYKKVTKLTINEVTLVAVY